MAEAQFDGDFDVDLYVPNVPADRLVVTDAVKVRATMARVLASPVTRFTVTGVGKATRLLR